MESALNLFYFAMAAYGWSVWYFGRSDGEELPVSVWGRNVHGIAIALIVAECPCMRNSSSINLSRRAAD